jgi:phospholipid/cholesterol/gamma-HCH transport system substrate-binding protein
MRHRKWLGAIVIASAGALTACASITPDALPQPGKSYTGGYDIVLQFDNVLNLPERAKVVMGGTEVGVVSDVAVAQGYVNVTARIEPGVSIPANVRAALQQATVLGDIYLTLDLPTDQSAAAALAANGTVPIAQTTSPPQLEDTIARLANFVTSGSIQRLQNTIIGINRVQPAGGDPAIRKMATQVASNLADISNNIDTTDKWLAGVRDTTQILNDRLSSAQYWFSPRGMVGFDRATQIGGYLSTLFPSVGSVYTGGYWLVPLLHSLEGTVNALRVSKWSFEDEYPAWNKLFITNFLPQDKNPAINITSIVGPDGRELSGNVQDVLRMLGATP